MENGIGSTIRKLRQAKGISIEELAREAYCSCNYMGALERGDDGYQNPTIDTLKKIADALEVEVADLLGRKEEAQP